MTRNTGIEVTAEFDPRTIDKKYSLEPMHNNDVSYERFQSQQGATDAPRRVYKPVGETSEFKAVMVGLCIKALLLSSVVAIGLCVAKVLHVGP